MQESADVVIGEFRLTRDPALSARQAVTGQHWGHYRTAINAAQVVCRLHALLVELALRRDRQGINTSDVDGFLA